jgi:hypothetical protein
MMLNQYANESWPVTSIYKWMGDEISIFVQFVFDFFWRSNGHKMTNSTSIWCATYMAIPTDQSKCANRATDWLIDTDTALIASNDRQPSRPCTRHICTTYNPWLVMPAVGTNYIQLIGHWWRRVGWHGMHYSQPVIQQCLADCVLNILFDSVEHPAIRVELMARPVGCWKYYIWNQED